MSIDTLWYTRCPVPTAFSIAVQRGLLDEEFGADGAAGDDGFCSPIAGGNFVAGGNAGGKPGEDFVGETGLGIGLENNIRDAA